VETATSLDCGERRGPGSFITVGRRYHAASYSVTPGKLFVSLHRTFLRSSTGEHPIYTSCSGFTE
jgi:hypothetical protein